jgi:glutamate/tyrosine decarboxylase-like PLP-dependent enzyme
MPHPFSIAAHLATAFRETVADRAPRPRITPEALELRFAGPTPEHGAPADAVIEALAHAAEPGLVASVGPRFFGWVIGASHEAGVAADWLTSAWGQNCGLYAGAPAGAMAEKVSAGWLLDILRLPAESSVGFVSGATMANFTCLAAARSAMLARAGWDVEAQGLQGAPRLRVVLGEDAHSTVFAALRLLGLGASTPVKIKTDSQGRMRADTLAKALAASREPTIVIAQAGQINTGAIDPAREIAALCARNGAWLHVDGAFGLWARACPEFSAATDGLDQADSWAVDGHKWLQLPYDSGFAIVRDEAAHRRAMAIHASYLPSGVYEPGHYTPELSRRARGFAVWSVLKTLGRTGVREMISRHCRFARDLARRLSSEPGIRIANEVALNQIIVRFGESDALTRATIAQLQEDNICFAEGAAWRGEWMMRLSIISAPLTEADIDRLQDAVVHAWRTVKARHTTRTQDTLEGAQP